MSTNLGKVVVTSLDSFDETVGYDETMNVTRFSGGTDGRMVQLTVGMDTVHQLTKDNALALARMLNEAFED